MALLAGHYHDALCHVFDLISEVREVALLSAVCGVFRKAAQTRLNYMFRRANPQSLVRYGKEYRTMWSIVETSIYYGRITSVKFFCDNGLNLVGQFGDVIRTVIKSGQIEIFVLMVQHYEEAGAFHTKKDLVDLAVEHRGASVLDYLYQEYGNELPAVFVTGFGASWSERMVIVLERWSEEGSETKRWARERLAELEYIRFQEIACPCKRVNPRKRKRFSCPHPRGKTHWHRFPCFGRDTFSTNYP